MSKGNKEFNTRTERRLKQKSNRLVNTLIVIVVLLIGIKVYFLFSDNDEVDDTKNVEITKEKNNLGKEQSANKNQKEYVSEEDKDQDEKNSSEVIITSSNDDTVEEVIVNNNWKVTPTKQSGDHVSTFQEGHIDYEEKLVTIRNAVELGEDDIIYWSVKNDGTNKGAIAVVSSKDQTKRYRVQIKWIENAGWIPVKVEVLKTLERNNDEQVN